MNRRHAGLVFTALFLCCLTAFFPLRLALVLAGPSGLLFTARSAEGSVWNGVLHDLSFDTVSLGDFSAKLSFWRLFTGEAAIALRSHDDPAMRGTLRASYDGFGAKDVRAGLSLPGAFDPIPVETVELTGVHAFFANQKCVSGGGQVRVTLARDVAGIPPGLPLVGSLRCDGDMLALSLTSDAGAERVMLRVAANGYYSVKLIVRAQGPGMASGLSIAGFRETAVGYVLSHAGRL